MKPVWLRTVLVVGLLSAAPAGATDAQDGPVVQLPIHTFQLDNGLRVVVVPDSGSPTVALAVYYDVGSRNEERGRSGFAHLFEHMMFQGSENVGKGEHFSHIMSNGGTLNGTTSEDRTNYFETLPSDRVETGLWLEADRMLSLDVSTENFENQRQVVKEERRLRVDNQPYVPAWLAFYELAYENWANEHSVIGSMEDLDSAQVEDVQAFFRQWYAPNNAVLTLAGDIELARARELVERWFSDVPRGPEPPEPDVAEPPQLRMREAEVTDAIATQPALLLGWHIPPAPDPQNDAALLLNEIIGGGESSLLYETLIREQNVAIEVSSDVEGRRGPDLLIVSAITNGTAPADVQAIVLDAIDALGEVGVTQEQLETARTRLLASSLSRVESNLGRALTIGRDALYFDDPGRINSLASRLGAISVQDVNAVLSTHIVRSNLSVMRVQVAEEAE